MARSAFLALVLLLFVPSAAAAALPKAQPPDVRALKAKGVEVDWPLTRSVELSASHFLDIKVRSRRPVTLSLVLVGRNGRPLRSVARTTLRTGSFQHFMSLYRGKRLALRLDVGAQRYWSWIRVHKDPDRALVTCEHGAEVLPTLELAAGPLRAGQTYTVGLRNGGCCPMSVLGIDDQWLRPAAAGGWESIPIDCVSGQLITDVTPVSICDRVGVWALVRPRGPLERELRVPVGLPPGRYLLRFRYRDDQPPLEREVDVVA